MGDSRDQPSDPTIDRGDPLHQLAGFDTRYLIERELGSGGMGRIFAARDQKLGREVAIKVLAPGTHGEDALRRFEQEARAAGSLDHPNVLAVHDIGTWQGGPYIVSELLHGRTLRERLQDKALPVPQAVDYALQLAQGLSAAHDRGVIHRDLKPENLFVTHDGRLKILDFGIAKLLPTAGGGPGVHTDSGAMLGTVSYMSPEQVRGEQADARSDIFAVGTILHEMLSGQRAFDRGTHVEVGYAILNEDPPELPARIPRELDRIVRRCLEKDAKDRFQSAHDLALALARLPRIPDATLRRWRWTAVLVALAAAVIATALAGRVRPRPAAEKSIAVLPFQNLSPDPENAYFADGMTEDILTHLAKIGDLRVIARTSVMQYKGSNKPVREIARELNVGAVLEGSVRRVGNRVRIVGQLIDASTEQHLWADSYDRDLQNVFAIQTEVSQQIADALKAKLTSAEKALIDKPPTRSVEAYDLYLRGRELNSRVRRDDNAEAIALFEKALALDPQFALGWAGLADAYQQRAELFGFGRASLDKSIEASRTALRLDPVLVEGHLALGNALISQGRHREAMQAMRRAVDLKPSYSRAVAGMGRSLRRLGRHDESLPWLERSIALDPRSAEPFRQLGVNYDVLEEPVQAEAALRRALELEPEVGSNHWNLVVLYLRHGRKPEALAQARKAVAALPGEPLALHTAAVAELVAGDEARARELFEKELPLVLDDTTYDVRAYLAYLYRRIGRRIDAEKLEEEALRLNHEEIAAGGENWEAPLDIAYVHAVRGEKDDAFRWLERAVQFGWRGWAQARFTPLLDPLRDDPRFQELMSRIDAMIADMRRKAKLG